MKKKTAKETHKSAITTLEEHLDLSYGKLNTPKRKQFEERYEAFKMGVMIKEIRKMRGLTQEELAFKCGTTKNYISRIENDASDIRLSTLLRIVDEGLNARLSFQVEI